MQVQKFLCCCYGLCISVYKHFFLWKYIKLKQFFLLFSRTSLSGAPTGCSLCSSASLCGDQGELHLPWLYPSYPEKQGLVGGEGQERRRGKVLQVTRPTPCFVVPSLPVAPCSTAYSQQEDSLQGTRRCLAPQTHTGGRKGNILQPSALMWGPGISSPETWAPSPPWAPPSSPPSLPPFINAF